jgi:hypothetical protein
MGPQVTAQSIAYAAVWVHQSLHHFVWLTISFNHSHHWVSHYNGFNHKEFYEFIINFFEVNQTPVVAVASKELFSLCNLIYFGQAIVTCGPTRAAMILHISLTHLEQYQC